MLILKMAQQNREEILRERQCAHVNDNLARLVEITDLNPHTIAIFLQGRILSSADVSELEAIPNRQSKNLFFYSKIVNRDGFYNVLIEAMKKTCQHGVVNLVSQLDVSDMGGSETVSEIPKNHLRSREAIVVGSKDCPIFRVNSIISNPDYLGIFSEKWSQISRELGMPNHQVIRIRQNLTLDKYTLSDAVYEILETWVGKCGRSAKFPDLIQVLEGNGLKNCAEALEKAFSHQL